MYKRFFAAIVAGGLALSGLAACGNDTDASDVTSSEVTVESPSSAVTVKQKEKVDGNKKVVKKVEEKTINNDAPKAPKNEPVTVTKTEKPKPQPKPTKTKEEGPVLVPGNDDPVVGY